MTDTARPFDTYTRKELLDLYRDTADAETRRGVTAELDRRKTEEAAPPRTAPFRAGWRGNDWGKRSAGEHKET